MKFQFLATPVEIRGVDRVEEVIFQRTGSDERFSIKCGLVITAIGYEAASIPGIPYERGKVVNNEGRVGENLYVVGWAKRGPSGVIGTNKSDSTEVMKLLVEGLKTAKANGDITDLLADKSHISQSNWEAINAAEISAGEPLGKPRKKFIRREDLLNIAHS
jgi:ferredoxin--NADP+ reductase